MISNRISALRGASCVLAIFALTGLSSVQAQMKVPGHAEPPPPPPMQAFDPALEPQVTIRETPRGTESEYRIRGKLYMIRVVPKAGGAPYYLLDPKGDGQFVRSDHIGPSVQPPMWVVHSF